MKYFVDKRIMRIVKETDLDMSMLAPEMYYEYRKSSLDGVIKENWYVGNGKCLDFVISLEEIENSLIDDIVSFKRDLHFKKHNVKPIYLMSYGVPEKWFNEETKDL